ncbi:MAG: mechanosensitive ion channel domain-containing protein [Halobacteriota archaeon]
MVAVGDLLTRVPGQIWLGLGIVLLGLILGLLAAAINRRLLVRAGVPDVIEGTSFERTARDLGTSTVDIISKLTFYFVLGVALLVALTVVEVRVVDRFWNDFVGFLPDLFFAVLVLILGVVIGDKVELLVAERLRGVKLPQTGVLPLLAKYSVIYVFALVALSQMGVATLALVVLLAAYSFAVVFLSGIAFKDLLSAGVAGGYLLLNQPYSIGDKVRVGETSGIVQEVDLFVTHIESDGEEYIVPNDKVFDEGIVRVRA